MVRLPEKVIICPKFAWPKTAIGALGSSVLVKLKASARNCVDGRESGQGRSVLFFVSEGERAFEPESLAPR